MTDRIAILIHQRRGLDLIPRLRGVVIDIDDRDPREFLVVACDTERDNSDVVAMLTARRENHGIGPDENGLNAEVFSQRLPSLPEEQDRTSSGVLRQRVRSAKREFLLPFAARPRRVDSPSSFVPTSSV